jgi:nucleoid DNA-binding protein
MATKKDLIKTLISKYDYLSKEDAGLAVDSMLEYLKEELCKKNRVEIRGFGSFSVREKRFAGEDKKYNTVYFRASKMVEEKNI